MIKHGTQVAILGLGALLPMALEVAKELEAKGFSTAVINPRSVKPLDIDTISFFARSADVVVTMEDHVLPGGFGSAVLEELSAIGIQTPVVRIGWPDAFVDHGKPDALRVQGPASASRLTRSRKNAPLPEKSQGRPSSHASRDHLTVAAVYDRRTFPRSQTLFGNAASFFAKLHFAPACQTCTNLNLIS